MQAPILTLGTRRWTPGAPVSSAVNRETFRLGMGCSGCFVVASPGRVGRLRDARSKQEGPMRFRILIDIRNLSYTVAALTGGLGAFCGAITNVLVYPNLARRRDGTSGTGRDRAVPGDRL